MATFKKSPLSGNAITPAGKMLEFTNGFFTTEKEDEIAYLKEFDCYSLVEDASVPAEAKVPTPKTIAATVGTIASNAVTGTSGTSGTK